MTIELPILGLLKERAMHGYELRQALEKVVGNFGAVSWGSLYPMLKKLEEREQLTKATEPQKRGSERQVYRITPLGEQRLLELLSSKDDSTDVGGRSDFLIKIAFFHLLNPSQRLELLKKYKSAREERLARITAEQERIGDRTNCYRQALLEYALMKLKTDIEWLNSLIRIEKGENLK